MNDTQFGLLVAAGLALFAALIAHVTVCAERHVCVNDGTCTDLNSGHWYDPSCSFRTTVTPAGFKLLNASVQYETMQRMNRGVCSPGLRQQVDSAVLATLWTNLFIITATNDLRIVGPTSL